MESSPESYKPIELSLYELIIDNTYEHIYELIKLYHNPNLVIPTEDSNGNIIYHLYSDGEITYQKGGSVYLQRTEFPSTTSINSNINLDINRFPLHRGTGNYINNGTTNTFGYIIATYTHCIEIRNKMLLL